MQPKGISFDGIPWLVFTGLAQLVEHWSPKPGVGSSSLSTRAGALPKAVKKIIGHDKLYQRII